MDGLGGVSALEREHLSTVLEKCESVLQISAIDNPAIWQIRRLSADLRFLLVESHLRQAWKLCGFAKEPTIELPPFLMQEDTSAAKVILGGGASVGGLKIAGMRLHSRRLSDEEIKANYEREKPTLDAPPVAIGLTRFLDGRKVKIGGKAMTRRQVIKYVANKLGGVHYDRREREPPVEQLRRSIQVLGMDPIMLEVLAYGQQISESQDFAALLSRMRQILRP